MQKKKGGPKAEEGGFTCDVGGIKEDVGVIWRDTEYTTHEKVTINSPHALLQWLYANEKSKLIAPSQVRDVNQKWGLRIFKV